MLGASQAPAIREKAGFRGKFAAPGAQPKSGAASGEGQCRRDAIRLYTEPLSAAPARRHRHEPLLDTRHGAPAPEAFHKDTVIFGLLERDYRMRGRSRELARLGRPAAVFPGAAD